jgi:hypothetical protein
MEEDRTDESTMTISGITDDGVVCPFSRGRWKKVGDAFVLFWLIAMPILYLIVFLTTR